MAVSRERQLSDAKESLRLKTSVWIAVYGSLANVPIETLEPYYHVKETARGRSIRPRDDASIIEALAREMREERVTTLLETPQAQARESLEAEQNRQSIVDAVRAYNTANAPALGTRALTEDHQEVMSSIGAFLERGERYGYISLPTGWGKTYVIAALVSAINTHSEKPLKTVILSPTQLILEQNEAVIAGGLQEGSVGTYYGYRKQNLDANVINTTYQSFVNMLVNGVIDPHEVGLVVFDEAHKALGEQRHRILRAVPNAVGIGLTATPYFEQLHGYEERGIVDKGEPWRGLFSNKIHEVGLEETMAKGILTPLSAHAITTSTLVESVRILGGDYDVKQLERYLNTISRNYLAVGMLAGLGAIPENVRLSEEQSAELASIHGSIKGKRTVIFGFSIAHIENLAEMLRSAGISAETVHGNVNPDDRRRILKAHADGDIQVLLGVDVLREGWNSPPTEVAIMLKPTKSGIVATQRLGRVLRQSPETGKTGAIAIEIVDRYSTSHDLPILIKDLFGWQYLLRGSMTGKERVPVTGERTRGMPVVEFLGMSIDSVFDEAASGDMFRGRFKGATLEEINRSIDAFSNEIRRAHPDATTLEFYTMLAKRLPLRVSADANETALKAFASIDTNASRAGYSAVIMLNMKTIIRASRRFMGNNAGENDEILASAIANVATELLALRSGKFDISQSVYTAAFKGAADYIASREGVPRYFVIEGGLKAERSVLADINEHGYNLARIRKILEGTGLTQAGQNMIFDRLYEMFISRQGESNSPEEVALRTLPAIEWRRAFGMLDDRQKEIIVGRFGLIDGTELTLGDLAHRLGLSVEWTRQIESRSLAVLEKSGIDKYLLLDSIHYDSRDELEQEHAGGLSDWPTLPSRIAKQVTKAKAAISIASVNVGNTANNDRLTRGLTGVKTVLEIRDKFRDSGQAEVARELDDIARSGLVAIGTRAFDVLDKDMWANVWKLAIIDSHLHSASFRTLMNAYGTRFESLIMHAGRVYDKAKSLGISDLDNYYVTEVLRKFDTMADKYDARSDYRIFIYGMAGEFADAFGLSAIGTKYEQKALEIIDSLSSIKGK